MATYCFHRLIMGKVEIGNFYRLIGDNRILFLQICLLAHLSRMLIVELLVYRGIRRPSVRRPSSTFSNDFFSEAAGPILLIFHI